MESKIKSYEEQVLELGNGKMLKPGCYNEKMKKLCDISDIKTLGIKNPGHRYYDDIDNIYYVVCPKSMNYFGSGLFSNMVNLRAVVLPDDLKEISLYFFLIVVLYLKSHCLQVSQKFAIMHLCIPDLHRFIFRIL